MKATNIIIDTDPGIDDAVALALAISSDKVNVKLISTMFGNVSAAQTAANVSRLLGLFGTVIPIAKGYDKPLTPGAKPYTAHGTDGLGGFPASVLPAPVEINQNGIEEAYYSTLQSLDAVTFVCLGPLTNLAKFLQKHRELAKRKITEIIFMGGSLEPNPIINGDYQIPYAEFNINIDPKAVKAVLASGIPLTMIPMELGHTAYLTPKEIAAGAKISYAGKVFSDIFPNYRDRHVQQPNIATHDMCAVCYLTNPEFLETKPAYLSVITDKQKQSAINVDFTSAPNATVAVSINTTKVRELYLLMLAFYPAEF